MKAVVFTFVVENEAAADELVNEVSESIGNGFGVPYSSMVVRQATKNEVEAHQELNGGEISDEEMVEQAEKAVGDQDIDDIRPSDRFL